MCSQELSKTIVGASLKETDTLEILYNWPGNVSTGEFFHRIFVALNRPRIKNSCSMKGKSNTPKKSGRAEIVIVDGLDHIEAKFPLLARERLFVPALFSLFKSYKICAVISSAQSKNVDGGWTNIRSMSDLLLEFSAFSPSDPDIHLDGLIDLANSAEQLTKISVERVPADQIGGSSGILYRGSEPLLSFKKFGPYR